MADLPTLDFSKLTDGSHQDQVKLGKSLVDSSSLYATSQSEIILCLCQHHSMSSNI